MAKTTWSFRSRISCSASVPAASNGWLGGSVRSLLQHENLRVGKPAWPITYDSRTRLAITTRTGGWERREGLCAASHFVGACDWVVSAAQMRPKGG